MARRQRQMCIRDSIYGAQVSIALVEYLRPELSFDNVETLVEQMASDCEKAKEALG